MDEFEYQMVPTSTWTEVGEHLSVLQATGKNVAVMLYQDGSALLPELGGYQWRVKSIGQEETG